MATNILIVHSKEMLCEQSLAENNMNIRYDFKNKFKNNMHLIDMSY